MMKTQYYLENMGITAWRLQDQRPVGGGKVLIVGRQSSPEAEVLLRAIAASIGLLPQEMIWVDSTLSSWRTDLEKHIETFSLRMMMILGEADAQDLLESSDCLTVLRESHHAYGAKKTPVCVSYDLNHLLRNPEDKRLAFIDWSKVIE